MEKQYAKDFLKKYLTVTGGPAAVDALDDNDKGDKAKEFVKKYFTVVGGAEAIDAAAKRKPENPEPGSKYLTMTLSENTPENSSISINKEGEPIGTNIQYRVNYGDWNDWDFTGSKAISVKANDVVQWKGVNPDELSQDSYNYIYFDIPIEVNLSGNVMSLIDGVGDKKNIPCSSCFENLFKDTKIKTVTKDLLPATKLKTGCYTGMFEGCTSLENAPELPATTLSWWCYQSMFEGCTSLKNAPELNATTLTDSCYQNMFKGCTSLKNAPELHATELADGCYAAMFHGCTNLQKVTCLATANISGNCTSSWLYGVASTGTFVKASGFNGWSKNGNGNGIPENWTVKEYGQPSEEPVEQPAKESVE